MIPRVGAKTLRFVKVPLSLPPTQKARASPHEGATPRPEAFRLHLSNIVFLLVCPGRPTWTPDA